MTSIVCHQKLRIFFANNEENATRREIKIFRVKVQERTARCVIATREWLYFLQSQQCLVLGSLNVIYDTYA